MNVLLSETVYFSWFYTNLPKMWRVVGRGICDGLSPCPQFLQSLYVWPKERECLLVCLPAQCTIFMKRKSTESSQTSLFWSSWKLIWISFIVVFRFFWVTFAPSLNLLCVVVESSYPSPFPCLLVSQSPGLPVYWSSAFSVSWSPCHSLSHSPGLLVSRHSVQV